MEETHPIHKAGGSSAPPTRYHSLKAEYFQRALERYVDENKPDPLVLQQIQGWDMEWSSSSFSSSPNNDTIKKALPFVPTDVLAGILTWKGEYMMADIQASCYWASQKNPSQDMEETNKMPCEGSLYFVLRAHLRFRTKQDKKKAEMKSKEKKAQDKIRTKMIQRLREDKFIQRLLSPPPNDSNKQKSSTTTASQQEHSTVLCEARITVKSPERKTQQEQSPQQLLFEERVDVTDPVAEGLRRALFSQAESSLDVVEALLSLPLLPGSLHDLLIPCPLADRAKLRLLEDAMFDACEREGEDELIDELNISSQDTTTPATTTNVDHGVRPKQPKKPQHNRSNKRTKR